MWKNNLCKFPLPNTQYNKYLKILVFTETYEQVVVVRVEWKRGVVILLNCEVCKYKSDYFVNHSCQFGVTRLFPTTIVTTYKCYYTIYYHSKWQKWIIFIGNSFKWKITSNKRHIYLFPNLVKVFSTGFVRKKICGKHLR